MAVDGDLVSLDVLHRILPIFGITKPTRAYERWVRPHGLLVPDFAEVIGDSPFVFTIDWRTPLDEALDPIIAGLRELGVAMTFDCEDPATGAGIVSSQAGKAELAFDGNDALASFNRAVAAVQRLSPTQIEFRQGPGNADGDTYTYAVLRGDEWRELESFAAPLIRRFFVPM